MSTPVPENDEQHKPLGSFTPDGAAPVAVFTGENFRTLMTELRNAFELALTNDEIEVDLAKAAANGPFCSDGYDAKATQEIFDDFKKKARLNLELLTGNGVIGPWTETADGPVTNQDSYDRWREVFADLEGIGADAKALKVSSWQSDAGEAYRANAAQRSREIESLQSLADASHGAMGAVSSIQATACAAVHQVLSRKIGLCKKKAKESPKSDKDFNGGSIAELVFYTRLGYVNARVEEMVQYLSGARSDSQPWVAASKGVNQELRKVVRAAMEIQTSDSNYNSDTNVEDRSGQKDESGRKGKDSLF